MMHLVLKQIYLQGEELGWEVACWACVFSKLSGKYCCACLQSGTTAASNLISAAVSTNTHGNAALEEYLIVFVYQQCWCQAALPGKKKILKKPKRWNLIFNNSTTLRGTVLQEIPFQAIRRQLVLMKQQYKISNLQFLWNLFQRE